MALANVGKEITSKVTSTLKTLKHIIQNPSQLKPWLITGPCSHPEYRSALPRATEYRINCPATPGAKAIIPSATPETVYNIQYHSRDQRRNRPPIRKYIVRKDDAIRIMKEQKFDVQDFPHVYLTDIVEEDLDAIGGGYQK
ncbi:hypothetical protein ACFE04_009506 [Oxalis oulophora]